MFLFFVVKLFFLAMSAFSPEGLTSPPPPREATAFGMMSPTMVHKRFLH